MNAPRISSAKAAARYIERGWAPVPIPARQKGPQIPGWQRLRMSVSDVPRYFIGGQNIGIITGKASGWLVVHPPNNTSASRAALIFMRLGR